jgi:eukaryotic-like serine/threonine-protein kinase
MRGHLEECEFCFLEVAAQASLSSAKQRIALTTAASSSDAQASEAWLAASSQGTGTKSRPPQPQTLGPYTIESVLGEGGMGIVYRAVDPKTAQIVAVKTVRYPTRPLFESLRQEIQLLSTLHHPGIVRVVNLDLSGGDPWYAMEFVAGETLSAFIRRLWSRTGADDPKRQATAGNGRLTEVLELMQKLTAPLSFLHSNGIIHCDLKPSNILLREGNEPVVTDFGLVTYARGAIDREALSFIGGPRGTVSYVAPEVLRGRTPDPRADLYAFGCIFYELVTGRTPFIGSRDELIQAHLNAIPVLASKRVRNVPPKLEALLGKLLTKDRDARLSHVADLEHELSELLGVPTRGPPRAHVFFRPQMVGRTGNVARFEERLKLLKLGHGSIVLVAGESGIGKTFFASEVAQRAATQKVKVIVGECDPPAPLASGPLETSTAALNPLRRYFEFLRDSCREGGPEEIERLLGNALVALAPYSPALAALKDRTEIPELSQLPQEAGRERLLAALMQTITAASKTTPMMLVLDDLQWADELSLALFDKIHAAIAAGLRLLVLGTYRLEEESQVLRELAARPDVLNLRLERLDRDAVSSMVRDMVAQREPDAALVDFVFSHAEGVPFFTAEYLRSIFAEGILARTEDGWRLSTAPSGPRASMLSSVPFPERLAELVRRRMAGLGERTALALAAGAVIGRQFEVDVLAHALGVTTEAAYEQLEDARLRQIVVTIHSAGSVRFTHDKFRETIYKSLPASLRSSLHLAAARGLELRYRDRPEFEYIYGDIARHYYSAGETAAAIDYLEKAGERALRISADAEALQFLNEALELERSLPSRVSLIRRARWERGVAEALHGLGRLAQSTAPLARAAELLGHPLPGRGAALGFGIMVQLLRRLLPREPAGAEEAAISLEMGRILERVLRISYYTGQNLQLLYSCVASLAFCERAGPSVDLATAYINAGATASIFPMHGVARSYIGRASELLKTHPDPVVESQLRMVEGVYYMGIGNQERAIERIQRGIQVAKRIGFGRREDECTAVRSAIDIHAGRHASIDTGCAKVEESARRRGDAQMISWALLQQLEALVMRGSFDEARHQLSGLWPLFPLSERPEKIWILGFAAYTEYRVGDWNAAIEHADQAAKLVAEGPPVHNYYINALDRLAELRIVRWHEAGFGRSGAARDRERQAMAACRVLGQAARIFPFAVPSASLENGLFAWGKNDRTRALSLFRRGIRAARRMGLEYHEARLQLTLAKASGDEHERRRAGTRAAKLQSDLGIRDGALTLSTLLVPRTQDGM